MVCTPLRWAGIDAVPPEERADLVAQMPWRTEAEVYEGTLKSFLPPGLRIPDLYFVEHLDEESAGIWMEDVQGLRMEGAPLSPALVRRGFAISVAIQSGLSALFPRSWTNGS
jgi:hypothetical protein